MTPSTPAAPPKVYLAAITCEDSTWLAAQLNPYLASHTAAEPPAFLLQACSLAQLLHRLDLPMAAADAVLLMAPPLSASPTQDSQAQALLMQTRLQLVARAQAFQLLFSQGQRLEQEALAALCNWYPKSAALQALRTALRAAGHSTRQGWSCEKCSDPDCELRLFQDLVAPKA